MAKCHDCNQEFEELIGWPCGANVCKGCNEEHDTTCIVCIEDDEHDDFY